MKRPGVSHYIFSVSFQKDLSTFHCSAVRSQQVSCSLQVRQIFVDSMDDSGQLIPPKVVPLTQLEATIERTGKIFEV